jgi:hypothetical protein
MSGGIIVLGMHRSGTSLIAEMLHRSGAFGRVDKCLPPNQWNARGYWELEPLVHLNTRLLQEVGADWIFPPSRKSDLQLAHLAEHGEYRDEAIGLLASMKSEAGSSWFWKDPRLSLLLPFWQRIWGNVRYVICVRDPLEICLSLRERDNLSFPVSILLWQRYMLATLEWTRKAPAIAIDYSAVLDNPAAECARLAHFLRDKAGPRGSASPAAKMTKAVDKHLQHCDAKRPHVAMPLTRSQAELQDTLERLAVCEPDAGKFDLQPCSLPGNWRGLLQGNLLLLRCQRRCATMSRGRIRGAPPMRADWKFWKAARSWSARMHCYPRYSSS